MSGAEHAPKQPKTPNETQPEPAADSLESDLSDYAQAYPHLSPDALRRAIISDQLWSTVAKQVITDPSETKPHGL